VKKKQQWQHWLQFIHSCHGHASSSRTVSAGK